MFLSSTTRHRLQAELVQLEHEVLPRLAAAVVEAKAQGDTSQNPDYFVIAEEERQANQRVAEITAALKQASDVPQDPSGVVAPGRTVTIDFGDSQPETFMFGSVEERVAGFEVITMASPIGSCIHGLRVGDSTTTPSGVSLTIMAISES